MASVTGPLPGTMYADGACTFVAHYDDATKVISAIDYDNTSPTVTARLTITLVSDGSLVATFDIPPLAQGTHAVPGNVRYTLGVRPFVPQVYSWTVQ